MKVAILWTMIITVTPNPAVDQTAWVDRLEPGAIHRVLETHIDPAGKGVNVSRVAHRRGWPTVAFGFLASVSDEPRATAARYSLRDPIEARIFLVRPTEVGREGTR